MEGHWSDPAFAVRRSLPPFFRFLMALVLPGGLNCPRRDLISHPGESEASIAGFSHLRPMPPDLEQLPSCL